MNHGNDNVHRSRQIQRYNKSPPYVTVNMAAADSVNTGIKKRQPLKIPLAHSIEVLHRGMVDCIPIFLCVQQLIGQLQSGTKVVGPPLFL